MERFMRNDRIGSAFGAHCLRLISCLAALVVASEAGAEALYSRSFEAGNGPTSVAVADLDGDTVPDLVTANLLGGDVSVLLGIGDGRFQAAVSFAAGANPRSVAVADLNGDTVPDLVTANQSSNDVSVLLGRGDGRFRAAVSFAAGSSPRSVAVADLDGDTVPDLVTANNASSDVSVMLNQCDPPALSVDLDIKPGSDRNAINPSSRGVVPVAILGSEDFDVADIDETTLVFGSDEAPLAGAVLRRRNDLNADGFSDLLARFRIDESGIEFGDTESCIQGRLVDGSIFSGCGAIQAVPDR